MKLDLSIGTARAIAQRLCDSEGVALVAPGTPGYEILRTLAGAFAPPRGLSGRKSQGR